MSDLYSYTYDEIMERMLAYVSDDLAKDEGSFIYTALGPVAAEHLQMYADINTVYTNFFISTADLETLELKASEYGLTRHEASAAVWSVSVEPSTLSATYGLRFNSGDYNLYVTGVTSDGYWLMTCEEEGSGANDLTEDPTPISTIEGFESATLIELVTAGVDEESEDDFRDRLLTYLQSTAASGNESDYYNWAMSVDGVGAAKVYPLADGAGTVTVVITDSAKGAASDTLIETVAEYIETVRPVGASVTVKSVEEVTADISATVTLVDGYELDDITAEFQEAVEAYFSGTAFDSGYVSVAYIGRLLLNLDGVEDYTDLTVAGDTANIIPDEGAVLVCGTVTLTEAGV